MRILLLLLAIQGSRAFAAKDLMSLCERKLTLESGLEVPLNANQIALTGPLHLYTEAGSPEPLGWLIADEFVRRNISPGPGEYLSFVSSADQVFILNDDGTVKVSGFLGQRQEMKTVEMNGFPFQMMGSAVYLFKERELTTPVTEPDEVLGYFAKKRRATVIKTITDPQKQKLIAHYRPWFAKYEANKSNLNRFMRVGRRRGFELAHFQTGTFGHAALESRVQATQIPNPQTGEPMKGPTYTVHKYRLHDGEDSFDLKDGEYLMLMDAQGLVTYEGMIGSAKFPHYAEDAKMMGDVAAKIKASHSAFAARTKPTP